MTSNALVIGGSRNIGYHAAVRLLNDGATVTFLLRHPSVFDKDELLQKYIQSGKALIVKGDATVESDVQAAWDEAGKHGVVDLIIFTVGETVGKISLTKGMLPLHPNLVTQAILNVLCTLPSPRPKLILVTSKGVTKASHNALPLLLKPVYSWLLPAPHADKFTTERCVAYCAGWSWEDTMDEETANALTGDNWTERKGLPAAGTLENVAIIRPALLTSGACVADKKGSAAYRVTNVDVKNLTGGYTVSRRDVAHFLVEGVIKHWDQYGHKRLDIAY